MRRSLGWPITLGVVMIVLVVILIVGWIVFTLGYWAALATGTVFLVLVLVGVVLYLLISIKEIRLNQRQSNFIDSVTHELKSPIASLKLYLQTLDRHNVTEQQQAHFHRIMLQDVERLDSLINHLLDAARLDRNPVEKDVADIDLAVTLAKCADTTARRYHLPAEAMRLELVPATVRARLIDVEMVFDNLLDNAVKYGGKSPEVLVESQSSGRGQIVVRVTDNGSGIPPKLRRKIFGRFVRLGNELERSRTGTGLGLFIVRELVKRLRGQITVRDRADQSGTVFEVRLPVVPTATNGDVRHGDLSTPAT